MLWCLLPLEPKQRIMGEGALEGKYPQVYGVPKVVVMMVENCNNDYYNYWSNTNVIGNNNTQLCLSKMNDGKISTKIFMSRTLHLQL